MSQIPLEDPNAPESAPQTSTALLERTETEPTPQLGDPGDHERFAHYVDKNKIVESAVTGDPVIALCGKVWVPGRDPEKFPVCPMCKEILDQLWPSDDSGSDSGSGSGDGDA